MIMPVPEEGLMLRGYGVSHRLWSKYKKLLFELGCELLLIVLFLKAYNLVRNQFGSQKCTPQFALGHALQIIKAERALGLFWEQEVQVGKCAVLMP